MEISSQGLRHDRTVGLNLSVAVPKHWNRSHFPVEHPTFEDYFEQTEDFDLLAYSRYQQEHHDV